MTAPNSQLRQALLAKRQNLMTSSQERTVIEEGFRKNILEFLNSDLCSQIHRIASYWPIRAEPDLRQVLTDWLLANPSRQLALPVTRQEKPLTFLEWRPETKMSTGLYGIAEPQETPAMAPELIFTPCLGWQSHEGKLWRLGYGGGYYDRTMASFNNSASRPLLVGIGFKDLEVQPSQWQAQEHDASLDALITELGIVWPNSHV